ncbi:acyltransferase family protein [Pseudonocardia phyllosphaerae]|uniref:acyltransferase family protein n=1 Tax=Pseudonocardia phyllosphaerae TaxID=3390502 RepID=UPI00397C829E
MFSVRSNAFDLVRLVLAALVAVMHVVYIGWGVAVAFPTGLSVATLGVDGFFVLSGFLVVRSYLQLDSLVRFAWHRFLRIMPGYLVCLTVIGLVVAPLVAWLEGRDPLSVVLGAESGATYIGANAGLVIFQSGIGGLMADHPGGPAFDVSLWSLSFEVACYAMLAALGVTALLRRRPGTVLALAAAMLVMTVLQAVLLATLGLRPPAVVGLLVELVTLFLLGMVGYLYRDRIPAHGGWAVAALAVLVVALTTVPDYRVLGAVPFAYLLLWVGLRGRVRVRTDLSYGVYIYHWPVGQLMVAAGLTAAGAVPFLLAVAVLVLLVAAASWHLVERPALGRRHARLPAVLAARIPRALVGPPAREEREARV